MKKILLIITTVVLASVSQAQFVASVQLGGSSAKSSYSASTTTEIDDSLASIISIPEIKVKEPLVLTGGLKFGYQFGRFQAGITGSFSWSKLDGSFDTTEYKDINQAWNSRKCDSNFVGIFSKKNTGWMVAPYIRYDLIQFGDVTLFLELNGYYAKTNNITRHDSADWYYREMHNTIDTTYTIESNSVSFGGKLVPGFTWQISPHCAIELFLDFMAFTYDHSIINNIWVDEEYAEWNNKLELSNSTTITSQQVSKEASLGVTGSPLLNSNRNWIRVGFNYTF